MTKQEYKKELRLKRIENKNIPSYIASIFMTRVILKMWEFQTMLISSRQFIPEANKEISSDELQKIKDNFNAEKAMQIADACINMASGIVSAWTFKQINMPTIREGMIKNFIDVLVKIKEVKEWPT
jgi:hypothetical protein